MYDVLRQSLAGKVDLTEAEFAQLQTYFIPKKLRKHQFLVQEGEVCRYVAFVQRGLLYSYATDVKGTKHVVQFGFAGSSIADLFSFLSGEPSRLHIEAHEDSELLLLNREQRDRMLAELPQLEKFQRQLLETAYVVVLRRLEGTLGRPAEERYAHLLQERPQLLAQLPQHLVASYLGITRETLSRLRSQLARQ